MSTQWLPQPLCAGLAAAAFLLIGCGGNTSLPQTFGPAQSRSILAPITQSDPHFAVTSTTFENDKRVPQSMVYNGIAGSTCTGGDKSPQLSWHGAPSATHSYTVLMFDVTASFTHWGMYNIPASTTSLPENAGVAGSTFGPQVINDFFAAAKYDGPCPPPGLVHHYVITVFAIDCTLDLPSPPGFPPVGETLLYALLEGRAHIIATTSITGLYST